MTKSVLEQMFDGLEIVLVERTDDQTYHVYFESNTDPNLLSCMVSIPLDYKHEQLSLYLTKNPEDL